MRSTGGERTVRFLRHLPEFGYEVRVLTTSAFGGESAGPVLRAWEPLRLYRWLFNKGVRAGATLSYGRTDAGLLRYPIRWLRRTVLVPDGQITWLPAALLKGVRALRRDPPDLLYSTYPPASAHLLALVLKGITGLPWVADFRDSWIYDPLDPALEELPYRRALEKRLEEAVVLGADQVIAATEISADYLRQAYPPAAGAIEVIPNGFEPDEFPETRASRSRCGQGPLEMVHTGSFSHSHPKRTPQPIFAVLEALIEEDPSWASRLRLVLVGHLSIPEQRAARRLERAGVVEIRGVLEREETLKCQQQAHVLLLVDHVRNHPASNVPGKFYEYLARRRPILALCGPGMVERMVRGLGAGLHADLDDPQAIRAGLMRLYDLFQRDQLEVGVDEAALRRFHRRELTRELARCFDRLVEPWTSDSLRK